MLQFDSNKFKKAIKQKRCVDVEWSGRKVAEKTGINHVTISRMEKGGMPELVNFANMCYWLGLPMESFFTTTPKSKQTRK